MSLCFVNTFSMNFVIIKLTLVSTTIYVLHYAFTCFLPINELAFINHTFLDFLFTITVRLRITPLAIIWKYFTFEVFSKFYQFTFSFKFSTFAGTLKVRPICKDKNAWVIFGFAIDYRTIIYVVVSKNYKYRLIFRIRNFTLFCKIKRSAFTICNFVYFTYKSQFLEMFKCIASWRVHQINK